MMTRKDAGTRGIVLARHLIQSFLSGETSPEKAHEIGLELCKRVLKDEYKFVIATHVDRGHIHNHIIFKELDMLNEEKAKLMAEYTAIKSDIDKLFTLQKNYKTFKENDLER